MGFLFSKPANNNNASGGSGSGAAAKPAGSKQAAVTSQDRAILQLKTARDKIHKYRVKCESESKRYTENARLLLKQNRKDNALRMLKLKKYAEQQIERTDNQLLKLQEMIGTIEWESQNLEFMRGLEAGNAALKRIHDALSVEDAQRIMDDTADAVAYQNEIDNVLAGNLSNADEEAALKELAEIEALEADQLAVSMPSAPITPVDVHIEEAKPEPTAAPAREPAAPEGRVAVPA